MTFRSILNPRSDPEPSAGATRAPAYFSDLDLDQIVEAITAGKDEYGLKPFFH
jgi:hypothetical protein